MNITVARAILQEYGFDIDFAEVTGKPITPANKRVLALNPTTKQRIELMSYSVFLSAGHKTFRAIVEREIAGAK